MIAPWPHDRQISTQATADEALEPFTVRLPQWPIFGLFRRNPLLRASDRIEAMAMVVAVVVSLLAIPIAAAVGTAVHDSRRDIYSEQHHTRHLVTATITEDTAAQNISRTNTATMAACWSAAGAEHTGAVEAQSATKSGDHVAIWVDNNGKLTDTTTSQAATAVRLRSSWWHAHSRCTICWPVPGQCLTVSAPSDGSTPSTP